MMYDLAVKSLDILNIPMTAAEFVFIMDWKMARDDAMMIVKKKIIGDPNILDKLFDQR